MTLRWPKRRTWPDVLLVLIVAGVSIALLGYVGGPVGLVAGTAIFTLVVVWRYDNATGTCFPLMLLLIVTITIMSLLLYLTVLLFRH